MVHFGEFLKTWSLRSNSVTRQVSFNRTTLGGKCQNSRIQMRHFEWFSNNVKRLKRSNEVLWNHPESRSQPKFLRRKMDLVDLVYLLIVIKMFWIEYEPIIFCLKCEFYNDDAFSSSFRWEVLANLFIAGFRLSRSHRCAFSWTNFYELDNGHVDSNGEFLWDRSWDFEQHIFMDWKRSLWKVRNLLRLILIIFNIHFPESLQIFGIGEESEPTRTSIRNENVFQLEHQPFQITIFVHVRSTFQLETILLCYKSVAFWRLHRSGEL